MAKVRYQDVSQALSRFVPQKALPMVVEMMLRYPIHLDVKVPRRSVYGDYLSPIEDDPHRITVNGDLNPYHFLAVFLHEYAHLLVYLDRKRGLVQGSAHGSEWQNHFRGVMQPFLREDIYPEPLLSALKKHMQHPMASFGRDPQLMSLIQPLDASSAHAGLCYIDRLSTGDEFVYRQTHYQIVDKKRTRYICQSYTNQQMYAFQPCALVKPISPTRS